MTNSKRTLHASDAELLAWLDGEQQESAQHIASCEECQQRALALRIEERRLQGMLFRAACPSAFELAEYGAGFLLGQRRQEIENHVAVCPLCSQELAWQRQFMRSLEVQSVVARETAGRLQEVRESIRVIVARWINQATGNAGVGLGMQFAMGAMRGQDKRPMLFDADELQVTLEFYEDPQHPGKHQLVGLLIGEQSPERFKVQLWQDDACVAETTVDDLGNFIVNDLPPAVYDLKLLHPKLEVQLNALDI